MWLVKLWESGIELLFVLFVEFIEVGCVFFENLVNMIELKSL